MIDSTTKRWVIAFGIAVVVGLGFTTIVSHRNEEQEKKVVDAFGAWKTRTGVDLIAMERMHPPRGDSAQARELDVLLRPLRIKLGEREQSPGPDMKESPADERALDDLRDHLRGEIRANSTEPRALSRTVVSLIDRHAPTLDAAAAYVDKHPDIHWREDFGPRGRSSPLSTGYHLVMHRLLIGRAFLALERNDTATARRMLVMSHQLRQVLAERKELESQFIAVGVERMQLALLRRAGGALDVAPEEPAAGTRQRFLDGMSAEALLRLNSARRGQPGKGDDEAEKVVRAIVRPSLERATRDAVAQAAPAVGEFQRATDGCVALAVEREVPGGMFGEELHYLDATEAWRRFQVLELDRAITSAVLTGRAKSPCPSVSLTIRDEGTTRTVEAKGLPPESDNVISLPSVYTTKLKPKQ